jgi:hypothetical protein
VARNTTRRQRTDLLPWAFAHDALLAPAIGACAIVLAPPADHPVFALSAATGAEPFPPKQCGRAHDAHAAVRPNDRPRLWQWSLASPRWVARYRYRDP